MSKNLKSKKVTPKKTVKKAAKKVATKKVVKKAAKKVATKKVIKKAAKKVATKKVIKKAAKKVATKKVVKKAAKKVAPKKTVQKVTVKENNSLNKLKSKSASNNIKLAFSIIAISPSEEDYSGATITEWFDTGREVDRYAAPDDYTFSPTKNSYKVTWNNVINEKLSEDLVGDIIEQILHWENMFDAKINDDSKISYVDESGKVIKYYSFREQKWI